MRFVRAMGSGHQNARKEATAVELRVDLRASSAAARNERTHRRTGRSIGGRQPSPRTNRRSTAHLRSTPASSPLFGLPRAPFGWPRQNGSGHSSQQNLIGDRAPLGAQPAMPVVERGEQQFGALFFAQCGQFIRDASVCDMDVGRYPSTGQRGSMTQLPLSGGEARIVGLARTECDPGWKNGRGRHVRQQKRPAEPLRDPRRALDLARWPRHRFDSRHDPPPRPRPRYREPRTPAVSGDGQDGHGGALQDTQRR